MQTHQSTIVVSCSSMKNGEIEIQGYKHAMVQIIAGAISNNTKVYIDNIPRVDDAFVLCEIINQAGGKSTINGSTFICDPSDMNNHIIDKNLCYKIHGAIYLMPAYLCRLGKFSIGKTGGCQIGNKLEQQARPLEHMLAVMKLFNTNIYVNNSDNIIGNIIDLNKKAITIDIKDFSTSKALTGPHISGATKTAILMPIIPKLMLKNYYFKTDVRDLIRFYQLLGYTIDRDRSILQIVNNNHRKNEIYQFSLTECVSEIMTYIALAVHTNIKISLKVRSIDSI